MKIIVSGSIGRLPVGGHAWVDMQYLAGLASLGHDVFYLEDCGPESWVYNWDTEELTNDLSYPANYIRDCLAPLGLQNRWIYRTDHSSAGISLDSFLEVCWQADLLLIRAVPLTTWRREYYWPRRRCYIDADPGFNQISVLQGNELLATTLHQCEHLFTIAQRLGKPDCIFPPTGQPWHQTLPPVSLDHWKQIDDPPLPYFTTIMQWRGFREVEYEGKSYGQKDQEFPKFINLPSSTQQRIRIALTGASPENLAEHGWEIVPGWIVSQTPASYQKFIQTSRAEFSIVKQGYAAMRGGWFSDRSVCYLASGRPVLVEDTGLSDWLPIGEGVVTFTNLPEAIKGIDLINSHYLDHCRAARRMAEEYFAAEQVLPPLLAVALN